MAAVGDFWAGNTMPKSFTSAYLALIPRKDNPTSFSDFYAISLCTFASKIITKVWLIV